MPNIKLYELLQLSETYNYERDIEITLHTPGSENFPDEIDDFTNIPVDMKNIIHYADYPVRGILAEGDMLTIMIAPRE